MRRVLAVAASGIALASCSSWNMSWDFMKPSPVTQILRFESEPQGAEVRIPSGQMCRTPCAMAVPASDLVVSYSLNGYLPQSVPVRARPPSDFRVDTEAGTAPMPDFDPNPVFAALELQPPPPPKRQPPRRQAPPPPRAPSASAPPPPAAAARPPAQQPSAFPAPPPASAASPWPAPQR